MLNIQEIQRIKTQRLADLEVSIANTIYNQPKKEKDKLFKKFVLFIFNNKDSILFHIRM